MTLTNLTMTYDILNKLDVAMEVYRETHPDGYKVATTEEVENHFYIGRKSFSIIAPANERTMLKIFHGSHRFKYSFKTTGPKHNYITGI